MLKPTSSMQAPGKKEKINLYRLLEDEVLPSIMRNNQVEFINDTDERFVIEFYKKDLYIPTLKCL